MYRNTYRTSLLATLPLLLIVTSAQAETGLASYYGGRGSGMTCAHRTRPMGSILTVSAGGRTIQCRVNDRGPFIRGRVVDLSVTAARALGMMRAGVTRVSVQERHDRKGSPAAKRGFQAREGAGAATPLVIVRHRH